MKRWLFISGGVLGLLALILFIIFSLVIASLDSLIKGAVEKYGSEFTRVEVTLEKADVSVTSGKGVLEGLSVGNPAGFKTERAFAFGEISLTLDTDNVTQDSIVIKEIVISAPKITYEIGPQVDNISIIQRNVESSLGSRKRKQMDQKVRAKNESNVPKLVIEHLYIRTGILNVSPIMRQGKKLHATLPEIYLTGIGNDSGGATPGQIIKLIVEAMGQEIDKAVATLDYR